MKKPVDLEEYKIWCKDCLNIAIDERVKKHYETVSSKLMLEMQNGDFWNKFTSDFNVYNQDYFLSTGFHLMLTEQKPLILVKPFDSLLTKAYRRNVIDNANWPNEPNDGWITHENWFEKISDLIRTTITVKYLDGIDFILSKIVKLSENYKMLNKIDYEAKEEGYYAVHVNLLQDFEIPNYNWDSNKKKVSFEIQITTQLQEVIKILLHKHYERNRKKIGNDGNVKWQWDYKSEEFSANYLGHILHYLEGMIMEVRTKDFKI